MNLIKRKINIIVIIKNNIGIINRGKDVAAEITPKEDICIIFRLLNL